MKKTFLMLSGIALFFTACKQAPDMSTEEAATEIIVNSPMEDVAGMPYPENQESYAKIEENKFENPGTKPLSTFSIDVDNTSYTNIRRFINDGQEVPKDAIRLEEMMNYFSYSYPQPKDEHPFSINS